MARKLYFAWNDNGFKDFCEFMHSDYDLGIDVVKKFVKEQYNGFGICGFDFETAEKVLRKLWDAIEDEEVKADEDEFDFALELLLSKFMSPFVNR